MTGSPERQERQEPEEGLAKVVPIRPAIPPQIKAELDRLKVLWRSQRAPWLLARLEADQAAADDAERVRQRALERMYREAP